MISERFRSWRIKKRAKVERAVELAGDMIVDELKREVSTPYPPASTPGSPPHARTYELLRGIGRTSVSRQAVGCQIRIFSKRPSRDVVPTYLEHGTANMRPRPYMSPMMRRWRKRFLRFIAEYLRANSG